MRIKNTTPVRLLAVAVIACTSFIPVAARDSDNLRLGPRTMQFPEPRVEFQLKDNARELAAGSRLNDGSCEIQLRFSSAAGDETQRYARLTALDPETCVYEVENAVLLDEPKVGTGVSDSDRDTDGRGGRSAAAQSSNNVQACYTSYWEDPPTLDVNSVRNCIRTNTTGNRIDSVDCSTRRYWLRESDWSQLRSTVAFDCTLNRGRGRSETSVTFKNTLFCNPRVSTFVDYVKNTAYADINSVDGYIKHTNARGDCESLLVRYATWQPGKYFD